MHNWLLNGYVYRVYYTHFKCQTSEQIVVIAESVLLSNKEVKNLGSLSIHKTSEGLL